MDFLAGDIDYFSCGRVRVTRGGIPKAVIADFLWGYEPLIKWGGRPSKRFVLQPLSFALRLRLNESEGNASDALVEALGERWGGGGMVFFHLRLVFRRNGHPEPSDRGNPAKKWHPGDRRVLLSHKVSGLLSGVHGGNGHFQSR